jgi:hypothetical protein
LPHHSLRRTPNIPFPPEDTAYIYFLLISPDVIHKS